MAGIGNNIGLSHGWEVGEHGWGDAMNANLRKLEQLVQATVVSSTAATPPTSPQIGQAWAVPFNATGAWIGWRGYIAAYTSEGWEYYNAKPGWLAWDLARGLIRRNTASWDLAVNLPPDFTTAIADILAAIAQLQLNDADLLASINALIDQLNAEIVAREGAVAANAQLISALTLRVDTAEGDISTTSGAISALEGRVAITEDGIEASALQYDLLNSRIAGRGTNVLPAIYASFEEGYFPPKLLAGGAGAELDPVAKHGDQSARISAPFTNGAVKFGPFAIAPSRKWIVSGEILIPALQGDDPSEVEIGLVIGAQESVAASSVPSGDFVRISAAVDFSENPGAQAYLIVRYKGAAVPTDFYVDCLMVEEWIGAMTAPSAWVMPPLPIAESSAYQGLSTRVTSTEETNDAHAQSITALQSAVQGVESANTANSSALSLLETRTTAAEGSIISQASQITSLQASVSTLPTVYLQPDMPVGTFNVGDIWFESDNGNKQYIWNGSIWGDTATIAGAVNYAQPTMPTGGSYNVGDQWIDTDNNNRLHRWDGTTWVDVSDPRITAQGAALQSLTTRVSSIEGINSSQSQSITDLQNTVSDPLTGLPSRASSAALEELSTRTTATENKVEAQSNSITSLSADIQNSRESLEILGNAQSSLVVKVSETQNTFNLLAQNFVTRLNQIQDDNILTPEEKPQVILDYQAILDEYAGIVGQAEVYGIVDEKVAYIAAVNALTDYLNSLTTPTMWNSLSGSTNLT